MANKVSKITMVLGVLMSLQGLAQVPPAPTCSQDEVRRISERAEQETLRRVQMDASVEGRVAATALGIDDRDCVHKATDKANWRRNEALDQCSRQATIFRNCDIVQSRVVSGPSRIQPVFGRGLHDEKDTNEMNCRQTAQNRAIEDALRACQNTFGIGCRVSAGPSEATFKTERRRRYGIAGPKEEYFICESSAQAIPDTRDQVQCTVEVVARVRFY